MWISDALSQAYVTTFFLSSCAVLCVEAWPPKTDDKALSLFCSALCCCTCRDADKISVVFRFDVYRFVRYYFAPLGIISQIVSAPSRLFFSGSWRSRIPVLLRGLADRTIVCPVSHTEPFTFLFVYCHLNTEPPFSLLRFSHDCVLVCNDSVF